MKTEQEAAKHWCPIATPSFQKVCQASCCMLWIWDQEHRETREHQTLMSGEKPAGFIDYETMDSEGFRWSSMDNGRTSKWYQYNYTIERGYCGLIRKDNIK